ncbi:hypothetical protein GPECTOR_31g401 [Gonium pectorale]|uniref:Uncharacterized protein n=1 Tax=Gonium pectorale TaxID=33097 RepID=A0A150GDW7_GONPE|nr:hypothetical protein GPECTOR_31g401 [Gonium pectorale]|eukprot:KXZ48037.1 hypothetical protein GPECTOR_31g401 [Gonium pectorale]
MNFRKKHQEVANDPEWYGPEESGHAPPAAIAAPTATVTNRSDVRLITSFTKYMASHKLDLSVLFCSEPLLSADSAPMCDLEAGHHSELLGEYLTSGGLRVGEELPHWFVHGNIRGAIKTWMATRPAADAVAAAGAAAADDAAAAHAAALVAAGGLVAAAPTAAAAAALVDGLLASMPIWRPAAVAELGGWEPGRAATAEDGAMAKIVILNSVFILPQHTILSHSPPSQDVALLHVFGSLAYGARLDCGEFLQSLCGTDPFTWVAGGAITEPQPWLLESFFMSRHVEGEALPLWFATWGVREEMLKWLRGPQAAELVDRIKGRSASPAA